MIPGMSVLLNVGIGPFGANGGNGAAGPWVGVDRNAEFHPDVVALAWDLPYEDGQVDAVYCGHLLEHLTLFDEVPRTLAEFRRVLRPGAPLMVVGPCMERALRERHGTDILDGIRTGWDALSPGFPHLWVCSESLLLTILSEHGWQCEAMPVENVGEFFPIVSRVPWQCAVLCR